MQERQKDWIPMNGGDGKKIQNTYYVLGTSHASHNFQNPRKMGFQVTFCCVTHHPKT